MEEKISEAGPDGIRHRLPSFAAGTGAEPPDEGGRLPVVVISPIISALGREVGMILSATPIFRFGASYCTVEENGAVEPMDAERFVSWAEEWLVFVRNARTGPSPESISKETASKILKADQFKRCIRELKGVARVRMPIWRNTPEGRTVELASAGYEPQTGIYTLDLIPYRDDLGIEEAAAALHEYLHSFPFDPEGIDEVPFRRSFAAVVGAMLGVYCHGLFRPGTTRPMVVVNANQPRAGKSLLIRLIICPVHGWPGEAGKSQNEAEFEKLLDTTTMERQPYLVLDDLVNLRSEALNRYITSPVHQCRRMGTQQNVTIEKITQVFVSGNSLSLSKDLEDRSFVVDLFEPGEAARRTFKKTLTNEFLAEDSTRSLFLSVLWALVREWRDKGMMRLETVKPSFEEWSGIIGGIVTCHGMANPFASRKNPSGGDDAGAALQLVIGRMVGEVPNGTPLMLTPAGILERAETDSLLETIVGFPKDARKVLGWKLKPLKGRHLVDAQGRTFEFGKHEMASGAGYTITFL